MGANFKFAVSDCGQKKGLSDLQTELLHDVQQILIIRVFL